MCVYMYVLQQMSVIPQAHIIMSVIEMSLCEEELFIYEGTFYHG